VTTLRNRNPNHNHLLSWSAEASSVENICGGALKLRAILIFHLSTLRSVTEAGIGFGVAPPTKNHFGN
jgi:hypothetical protein